MLNIYIKRKINIIQKEKVKKFLKKILGKWILKLEKFEK
tara:strand:+ start:573 stop:689 length:117 start_codon:yes stop_codon:yes gene_type:complete